MLLEFIKRCALRQVHNKYYCLLKSYKTTRKKGVEVACIISVNTQILGKDLQS